MRMPEPEVSLRLAINLIDTGQTDTEVIVSLDGAHIKTGEKTHFKLLEFMSDLGWTQVEQGPKWQTRYQRGSDRSTIRIHSQSGQGDVVAKLKNGRTFLAESKRGPLLRSKSSEEYPLIREALGQLLTLESIDGNPILAVAVPHGERFVELAARWRNAPLVKRAGILILTVGKNGQVSGWQ